MSKVKVLELYGHATCNAEINWQQIVSEQSCPFIQRKCLKVRKSEPENTIGTCSVEYGKDKKRIVICPHRFLEKQRIFIDSIHLLTLHEPGNDLHVVPEVTVPGGSVDYFLVSARNGNVNDFVGIEIQALDTTGTIWPTRQRFLQEKGINVMEKDVKPNKSLGVNWKMTAKTILVQLHHKLETFEHLHKHLVLAAQDHFLDYVKRNFQFEHVKSPARLGDALQIHSYTLNHVGECEFSLSLTNRFSTDIAGLAKSLGLQNSPKVGMEEIISILESKISNENILTI